jgi:poly-gamma-glutamate synthesis protein (capsule biosynthesis protein)
MGNWSRSWTARAIAATSILVFLLLAGCTEEPTSPPVAQFARPASPTGPPTLTLLAAGDVLLHPPLWEQAKADGGGTFNFDPIFSGIRSRVSGADLAICHLETPLAPADGPFAGYPSFSVPPQVTTAIRNAGFDTCSTASNHTLDQSETGVYRTLDALDAAGLHHAGSYRGAASAITPNIVDVRGVKVAQLSYTFGFNGLTRPAGKEWIANLIDPATIIGEAQRARKAGAEIVVVSMHWGTEYDHNINDDQQQLARQLLAAPEIDLILGCHAHVVQPFEKIGDKWVVYGMGNEIARHEDPIDASREGVMPRFTFTRTGPAQWRVTTAEAIPTWVALTPAIRIVDLPAALATDATSGPDRQADQAAYDRISGYLRSRGADAAGLRIVSPNAK